MKCLEGTKTLRWLEMLQANGQDSHALDRAPVEPFGPAPHIPSGPSPGGALSHLASHCCVDGGRRVSAHSRDGWPVWLEQRTARCCCPIPHCAEHCGESLLSLSGAPLPSAPVPRAPAYLAPLACHPAGRGTAAQVAAHGGWRLGCGRAVRRGQRGAVVGALAQDDAVAQAWPAAGGALQSERGFHAPGCSSPPTRGAGRGRWWSRGRQGEVS